jgi:hypothetical protein
MALGLRPWLRGATPERTVDPAAIRVAPPESLRSRPQLENSAHSRLPKRVALREPTSTPTSAKQQCRSFFVAGSRLVRYRSFTGSPRGRKSIVLDESAELEVNKCLKTSALAPISSTFD